MEMPLHIDVAALDQAHRRAVEDILGRALQPEERLIIQVASPHSNAPVGDPSEVLGLLTHFYDGMSDKEIESIDREIKTRANLSRPLP
jgi:hypothetical protein